MASVTDSRPKPQGECGVDTASREEQWAMWMRAATSGDSGAYRLFLKSILPHVRAMALRRCESCNASMCDAEDIVQETLLAIHLKRGTWDPSRPIRPWISTIVRNKLIDALRRRGRRTNVPIDDVIDTLEAEAPSSDLVHRDVDRLLARLKEQQRTVVRAMSVEGYSARETADRLNMTEASVRVALHRALKALAALHWGSRA
jgi:RNA polymerase sigma-70 factor (ECF subfamily)